MPVPTCIAVTKINDHFVLARLANRSVFLRQRISNHKRGYYGKKDFCPGFFDGVHLGHQALLSACREMAAKEGSDHFPVYLDIELKD